MTGNPERREHKRYDLPCPIVVSDAQGNELARQKTCNVSNGGAFLPVPAESAPSRNSPLKVNISVPRSTPNTYMLEQFAAGAKVVRIEELSGDALSGVAIEFTSPLELTLEV